VTVEDVARDPSAVATLAPDDRARLLAEAVARQQLLGAVIVALAASAMGSSAAASGAPGPRWLSIKDAAERLGLEENHVRELCRRSEISALKRGTYWRICEDVLDQVGGQPFSGHEPGARTSRPAAIEIRRSARDGQEVGDRRPGIAQQRHGDRA
jgi:excisionase family DNA binding protein